MPDVVLRTLAVRLVVVSFYSYEVIIRSTPGYLGTRSWIITRAALYSIMRSSRARYALSFDIWRRSTCWSSDAHFAHRLFYVSCIIDLLPVSAVADTEIFNSFVCDILRCIAVKRIHYIATSATFFFKRLLFYWHVKAKKNRDTCSSSPLCDIK